MHEYDICTYLCLTLSYLQRINYLERKKNTTQRQKDNISTRQNIQSMGIFISKFGKM